MNNKSILLIIQIFCFVSFVVSNASVYAASQKDGCQDPLLVTTSEEKKVISDASGNVTLIDENTQAKAKDGSDSRKPSRSRKHRNRRRPYLPEEVFYEDWCFQDLMTKVQDGEVTKIYGSDKARYYYYEFNGQGGATKTTGNMTKAIGNDGIASVFLYDTNNNQTRAISFVGSSKSLTKASYRNSSNKALVTKTIVDLGGANLTESSVYDSLGQLTTKTPNDGTSVEQEIYQYDSRGRITSVQPAGGRAAQTFYDVQSQVTKQRVPFGSSSGADYSDTTMLYDGIKQTKVIDPRGYITSALYDSNGNFTKMTDALSGNWVYNYSLADQITKLTMPDNNSYSYDYDAMGNLTKETDPLGNTKTNAYDPYQYGMVTKSNNGIAGDGGSLYYRYDGLQRLTHSYAMNTTVTLEYSYMQYDINNNVTKMGPGPSAPYFCTWAYDGDTAQLTHRTFGWLTGMGSPLSKVDFFFDRPGRLTKMDKGIVQWQYQYRSSSPWELTAIRSSNSYGMTKSTNFEIDAYGKMTKQTLGNGVYTTYQYDDSGALTRMAHQKPRGWAFARLFLFVRQELQSHKDQPDRQQRNHEFG